MNNGASKESELQSDAARNRCIWMTAGVISFKLCPLDYDCDDCDFHRVMRSQMRSSKSRHDPHGQASEEWVPSSSPVGGNKLPLFTFSPTWTDERLKLHPSHLWVQQAGSRNWRVGVDGLLAYILPPPEKVEWHNPDPDEAEDRVQIKVLTGPGEILLTAPLSGSLIQGNPELARRPGLLQQDPCGKGWLVAIDCSPRPSELERLYARAAGKRFLEEEAQHLRLLLKHRGIQVDQIGETLPDGGLQIRYLHQILPGRVCLKLALELIASSKQSW
jgi:glycine cleavage system H protein